MRKSRKKAAPFSLLVVLLLAVLAIWPWTGGQEKKLAGKVVSVVDGDTIWVLDVRRTRHKIRLQGIDAPERSQPFGARAKQALSRLVFGKDVVVTWKERDRYGRILGHVYLPDGTWVNEQLVRLGYAWHYKRYSNDPRLAQAEQEARAARVGLWADPTPIPPWEFRRRKRSSSSGVRSDEFRSNEQTGQARFGFRLQTAQAGSLW